MLPGSSCGQSGYLATGAAVEVSFWVAAVFALFPDLAFRLLLSIRIPAWIAKLKPGVSLSLRIPPSASSSVFLCCTMPLRNTEQADPLNPCISQYN